MHSFFHLCPQWVKKGWIDIKIMSTVDVNWPSTIGQKWKWTINRRSKMKVFVRSTVNIKLTSAVDIKLMSLIGITKSPKIFFQPHFFYQIVLSVVIFLTHSWHHIDLMCWCPYIWNVTSTQCQNPAYWCRAMILTKF